MSARSDRKLEALQHQGKALRAELAAPNAPKFLETRDGLQRQVLEDTPALPREEKLAAAAVSREVELKAAIDVARTALAAAEQKRLSPALLVVPLLSFCLLSSWAGQGDTVLADKTFAGVLATVSAALLGFIVGGKLWAAPGVPQAPLPARAWGAFSLHGLRNPSAWALAPFAAAMVLLITAGATLSALRAITFVELGWCQAAALAAFALALRGLASAVSSHQGLGRIESTISGGILVLSLLLGARVLLNQWFNGGGLLTRVALAIAVMLPLLAGATWFWLEKRKLRRPAALWLVPALLSMVASVVVGANAFGESELEVPAQVLTYAGVETPRVPAFLVRDEGEFLQADHLLAVAGSTNGPMMWQVQSVTTHRAVDLSAFLLAVQFGLIGLLGAWLFSAAETGRRRWLVRLLPLVPVALLVAVVLVRGS